MEEGSELYWDTDPHSPRTYDGYLPCETRSHRCLEDSTSTHALTYSYSMVTSPYDDDVASQHNVLLLLSVL